MAPDWQLVADEAMERATAALEHDVTEEELVKVVRQLAVEMRQIPPRVRATEACAAAAEELVEVLADAGVSFASPHTASAQVGASMLAAWMQAAERAVDAGDWADVVGCVPQAVAWAIDNAEVGEPWAVETVRRLVATEGTP
jgi:bacterioferritin-associated ferredoxin